MAREPSIAELVDDMVSSRLNDVHTMQPGTVVSYDRATHTAEVKLGIKRTITRSDGSELLEEVPPIPNLPVALPKAGGFYLQLPIVPGDEGMLLFSETAWGHFRQNGQLSPPGDLRRHSLGYAAFLPCGIVNDDGYDTSAPAGSAVLVVPSGKHLSIRRPGSSDDFVALAARVDALFQALADAIAGVTPAPPAGVDAGEPGLLALKTALATFPDQSTASESLKAGPA